jgi:sortase A
MAGLLKTRWIWIIAGLLLLVVGSLRLSSVLSSYFQPVNELAGLSGFREVTLTPDGSPTAAPNGVESGFSASKATLPPPALGLDADQLASLPDPGAAVLDPPADEAQSFFAPVAPPSPTPQPGDVPATQPSSQFFPEAPERLVIRTIGLDAPVVEIKPRFLVGNRRSLEFWTAPEEFAAGWMLGTASIGEPGNTVLNGHHNLFGEVFRHLVDLQPGDSIQVYTADYVVRYQIANKMILQERDLPLAKRMENARWIMPSEDERLTLVTCWPYTSNTHRLIIVARPVEYRWLDGDPLH